MCNSLTIDQKGRLRIPMTLLTTLKGPGAEFYVTSENGDSVRIYPMRVWTEVEVQLRRLCLQDMNNQKLLSRVKYFGHAVTLDKQGRVLIPIVLRNNARMKGAVDVLDYANYLEVWNHTRLMNNLKRNPVMANDEKTLNEPFSVPRSLREAGRNGKIGNVHGKRGRFGVHSRAHGNLRGRLSRAIRSARPDPAERARVA